MPDAWAWGQGNRGQYGNRLDTEAGRAKEAQMAAAAQALVVAQAEAVQGRKESAQQALNTAYTQLQAPNPGGSRTQGVISSGGRPINNAFAEAFNKDATRIQGIINTPPEIPSGGNGGGDNTTTTSGTSYYVAAAPVAVPPPYVPPPPPPMVTTAVRQADPSIIQYNEQDTPQELLTYLLYEDVSGTELINISRHDTINGQQVGYSLIRNLSVLNQTFNPNNILAGQTTYAAYLNQYSIDLPAKLPIYREAYIDENGQRISDDGQTVYLNENGDLIIEFTNLNNDEYAEIEISTNGTIYSVGV